MSELTLDADTTLWAEAREMEDASLLTDVRLAREAAALEFFPSLAVERSTISS